MTPTKRQRHQRLRQKRTTMQRGVDTHRNSEHQGNERRSERQFKRRGQAFGDQGRDLPALSQTQAEFALSCMLDKVSELDRKRPIESEVGAELLALFGGRVLPEDVRDRVADVLKKHEGNECDAEHHEQRLEQAADDEGEH